ncbi:hypothetical protein SteCoe_32621 [Stentor coeruleus]|uniref:EF-hand domain-containing protein n=1 Tax=Stentor coeruleus TaxID=5963 RepID=A0A1R2AYJ6_9CILI|nr:hypothetical protein SteCoe_32621 [Stentor coeruleus]
MGCYYSRESYSEIEKFIVEISESQIGFKNFESKYLDRVIHRYSTSLKISKPQLNRICCELKLDEVSNTALFNQFMVENHYCAKKLSSLGILLGQGNIKSKCSLYFKNYDIDNSGMLTKNEVEMMLEQIISIACRIIPKFTEYNNRNNPKLREYTSTLCGLEKGLKKNFLGILLDEDQSLTEGRFIFKCSSTIAQVLTSSTGIRKYAYEIFKEIERSTRIIISNLNIANIAEDNFILKKFKEDKSSKRSKRKNIGQAGALD